MNKIEKNNLLMIFLVGVIFIILGIKTLASPVYWFRGSYVDFTGYSTEVGTVLIALGLVFWEYCRRRRKR